MTDRTVELLQAILDAIRENTAELRRQRPVSPTNDSDAWLAALLLELARMPTFTAATAIKRAAPLLDEYARPNGAMALGRRLIAAVGVIVDGRSLVRRGSYRGCAVFSVRTSWTSGQQPLIETTADFSNEVRKRVAAKSSRL